MVLAEQQDGRRGQQDFKTWEALSIIPEGDQGAPSVGAGGEGEQGPEGWELVKKIGKE